jgi:hypothetical protein
MSKHHNPSCQEPQRGGIFSSSLNVGRCSAIPICRSSGAYDSGGVLHHLYRYAAPPGLILKSTTLPLPGGESLPTTAEIFHQYLPLLANPSQEGNFHLTRSTLPFPGMFHSLIRFIRQTINFHDDRLPGRVDSVFHRCSLQVFTMQFFLASVFSTFTMKRYSISCACVARTCPNTM